MRVSLLTLVFLVAAMLLPGCVVSETERGPGPGDEKKSSGDAPAGGIAPTSTK
jgi:hypothetical protein